MPLCSVCEIELEPRPAGRAGRPSLFCGTACRMIAYRRRLGSGRMALNPAEVRRRRTDERDRKAS